MIGNIILCNNDCLGILDTGSSYLFAPYKHLNLIKNKIGFKSSKFNMIISTCNKLTFYNLTFTINGYDYNLNNEYYMLEVK